MGAIMGLATIVGPLIGGGFTTNVSWRWCFYINLPFGGLAMAIIVFFVKFPERDPGSKALPLTEKLSQLDAPGTAALMPGVVCLLLALHWGGQTYAVSYSLGQNVRKWSGVLTLFSGAMDASSHC